MSVPPAFTDIIKNCCIRDMKAMLDALHYHIDVAERVAENPALLVDFVPDFLLDDTLGQSVEVEVEAIMAKNHSTQHATSQWLSCDGSSYRFGNKSYTALDLNQYPAIMQVMSQVNDHTLSTGDLNSCLTH